MGSEANRKRLVGFFVLIVLVLIGLMDPSSSMTDFMRPWNDRSWLKWVVFVGIVVSIAFNMIWIYRSIR